MIYPEKSKGDCWILPDARSSLKTKSYLSLPKSIRTSLTSVGSISFSSPCAKPHDDSGHLVADMIAGAVKGEQRNRIVGEHLAPSWKGLGT